MAKNSGNHDYDWWARRKSSEHLRALLLREAPIRARSLLTGDEKGATESISNTRLHKQCRAAAAELDERSANQTMAEQTRSRSS